MLRTIKMQSIRNPFKRRENKYEIVLLRNIKMKEIRSVLIRRENS